MIFSLDVILSTILLAVVLGTTVLSIPVIKETYVSKYVEAHKAIYESRFLYYYTNLAPYNHESYVKSGATETLPYKTREIVSLTYGVYNPTTTTYPLDTKFHKSFFIYSYNCYCRACGVGSPTGYYYLLKNESIISYYKYNKSFRPSIYTDIVTGEV